SASNVLRTMHGKTISRTSRQERTRNDSTTVAGPILITRNATSAAPHASNAARYKRARTVTGCAAGATFPSVGRGALDGWSVSGCAGGGEPGCGNAPGAAITSATTPACEASCDRSRDDLRRSRRTGASIVLWRLLARHVLRLPP